MELLDAFFRDVRYGSRSLRKTPGFAAAAILSLALGIGANTAIFSVLEGVVLDPLPYPHPDRLVVLAVFNRKLKYATYLSYPDFLDWQRSAHSFEQIAAFRPKGFDLSSPGLPEHVDGTEVSSSFLSALGVRPLLGRDFTPDEERTGGAPVLIGYHLWQERFAGSPAALGRAITLNGADCTIVGVLQPGFHFEDRPVDVYALLGRGENPAFLRDRTIHDILCIARLRPGVSVSQARAEMNILQERIDRLNPSTERGLAGHVEPLRQLLVGDVGGTLMLLLGAAGLVLLIACANVANLLVARSAARTKEFAVRLAVGASRMRIGRQLIVESVMLSLVGGALGLAVARWAVRAVLLATPGVLPRAGNIALNVPVLLFAFGVSITVGIVFGVWPALKSSKTDVQSGLKEGGRGSTGGAHGTQPVLVVVQIALALVLLAGATLLLRTIHNLWSVNPGFDPRHVITFQVGLSPAVANTPSKARVAYQQLTERIRRIPGVEAADITALVPMGKAFNEGPFWVGPQQPASMAEIPRAIYYPSGPDYLRTMSISLLEGRFITRADDVNSQLVVAVDSLLARTYFPGGDAVGKSITIPHWGAARNVAARIVGVVGHVEHYGLDGSMGEKPQIYYCFYQLPDDALPVFRAEVALAVRTRLDAGIAMQAVRRVVYEASSDQPVYHVHTMDQLVSGSMGRQRLAMLLLVSFALLALLLAFVGTFGVISCSTAQREHEIGIRIALGAARRDVLQMVIGLGLRLALSGIAAGAMAALILTRVLSSFSRLLFGVRVSDPATFLGVAFVLLAIALLACYIPARRASQVDPIIALRHE